MQTFAKLFIALALLVGLGGTPALLAQAAGAAPNPTANQGGTVTPPIQIALTGCLRRTGADNAFYLADRNGTTWKLVSDSVPLSEHMNQSVTVTGKVLRTPKQPEGSTQQSGGTTASGPELRVLTIQTLSPSCTR